MLSPLAGMLTPLGVVRRAAQSPLLDDLISRWRKEEESGTRADAHGSNHLSDVNTVTRATGKLGYAASFAAANSEYLSIASNSTLQPGTSSFSVDAWVKPASLANLRIIMAKDNGSGASTREFNLLADAAGRVQFYVFGPSPTFTIALAQTAGSVLIVGNWAYVVGWWDASTGRSYVQVNNGTVFQSSSTITSVQVTNVDFRIGTSAQLGNYWNGEIDEPGFAKRVYTADERTQLYNGGSGLAYPYY